MGPKLSAASVADAIEADISVLKRVVTATTKPAQPTSFAVDVETPKEMSKASLIVIASLVMLCNLTRVCDGAFW
jgi:hypothetical protein